MNKDIKIVSSNRFSAHNQRKLLEILTKYFIKQGFTKMKWNTNWNCLEIDRDKINQKDLQNNSYSHMFPEDWNKIKNLKPTK